MPNSVPISAKEESHSPRCPIASFSTSAASACCEAKAASSNPAASLVFIMIPVYPVPQTSRAKSTTSRSFASCISALSGLPASVEAKPHCGLSARRSSGT